jgi:uncharacterized membrane protein YkgB
MAPSTPPPPRQPVLAALTIAATVLVLVVLVVVGAKSTTNKYSDSLYYKCITYTTLEFLLADPIKSVHFSTFIGCCWMKHRVKKAYTSQ